MLEKWSINRLHTETGLAKETIRDLLKSTRHAGKAAGHLVYHLSDLVDALREKQKTNTNLEAEKLRKTTEEADKLAIENEIARGSLIDAQTFYKLSEPIAIGIKQVIMNSALDEAEKIQILDAITKLYPESQADAEDIAEGSRDAGQAI